MLVVLAGFLVFLHKITFIPHSEGDGGGGAASIQSYTCNSIAQNYMVSNICDSQSTVKFCCIALCKSREVARCLVGVGVEVEGGRVGGARGQGQALHICSACEAVHCKHFSLKKKYLQIEAAAASCANQGGQQRNCKNIQHRKHTIFILNTIAAM